MQTYKSFPDFGRAFQLSLLDDKLRQVPPIRLYATILNWALDNKPLKVVVKYVMDLYADDSDEIIFLIGHDTINLIKNLYYAK